MEKKDYTPPTMAEVRQASSEEAFKVVSTFAGCGGSSTGYRLAGGKVLAVNEFIEAARDTYKANYPDVHMFPQDIRQLTGEEILEKVGLAEGELDILDGSPPCASFSMSGKREKLWGKVKKYSDTKQRTDDLFYEFARVINEVRPRVFVAENVKGMSLGTALDILGTKQSDLFGGHQDTVLFKLEEMGYRVQYKVLNSADYGAPTARERLIIIGVRKDLGVEPSFPSASVQYKDWYTVRDAIEGLESPASELKEAECPKHHDSYKYASQAQQGEMASVYHPKGHYFNLARAHWDRPCPTVLQSAGSTSAAGILHPEFPPHRSLTIVEIKRVSTFPDDFILTGAFKQQWERVGRAVPPLLMKAVASHVRREILEKARGGP